MWSDFRVVFRFERRDDAGVTAGNEGGEDIAG